MRCLPVGLALSALMAAAPLCDAAQAAASPRERVTRRWAVEDGLPNGSAIQILETRDGYLLLPTWAGLFRFDGVQFRPMAMDVPNVHTLGVLEAKDGALWIASNTAEVTRWTPDSRVPYPLSKEHADNSIKLLAQDESGRIWIGSTGGLDVIDGKGLPARVASGRVSALSKGRDGVWAAVDGRVCRTREITLDCNVPRPGAGRAKLLLEDRRGTLWVAEETGGLLALDGTTRRFTACANRPACLDRSDIRVIADGAEGLWVGYASGRVDLVFGQEIRTFAPPGPQRVQALYEDRAGILWGISDGLIRLRASRVRMIERADGVRNVASIVQDRTGRIWAGGGCGPPAVFDGVSFQPRFRETGCTHTLLATRDGSLWVGTRDDGALRIHEGRAQKIEVDKVSRPLEARVLYEARDGAVWMATANAELHRWSDGRLSPPIRRSDGGALGLVVSIAEDAAGDLWVASNDYGLTVYRDGALRAAPPPSSGPDLPTGNISALLFDRRGDLWIGTAAHGLFRLRRGRYEAFGPAEGFPDRLIALILEDKDENIWAGTAQGIVRLDRANIEQVALGQARIEPIILDRLDGLLNPEGSGGGSDPSGLRDRDGSLWFTTIQGAAVVNEETFQLNRKPLGVSLEGVKVDGVAMGVPVGTALEVRASAHTLEIDYTAPTLWAPERARFEYRLIGLEDVWIDAGARRTAYFSRPQPGRYRFEVRVANADWRRGDPSTLDVVFLPLWWERRSVQAAGVGLLLLVSGGAVFKVASWRQRARVAALEREQAVHVERERIARDLHDDLGSRLAYISLLSDRPGTDQTSQIAAAAREAAQTIDELVWVVDARNDTVEGFANYVARMSEDFVHSAGLVYRVHVGSIEDGLVLEAGLRRNLYLAVKESIGNAIKHARASEIHLRMEVRDRAFLQVVIADNGVGLPESGGDPTGNGLRNIKQRLKDAGGTAEYGSHVGGGLVVTLTVPLTATARL